MNPLPAVSVARADRPRADRQRADRHRARPRPQLPSVYTDAELGLVEPAPAAAESRAAIAAGDAAYEAEASLEARTRPLDDPAYLGLLEREMLPHARALFRFAFKLCHDRDLAHDLVQDTMFKACRYIQHFKAGSNAKAWLFRILKNSFINEYRRRQRLPQQVSLQDTSPQARAQVMGISSRTHEAHSAALVSDEVLAAISAMPADYRLVVMLCDVEAFTYDEIAEIVGIPVGTVRSRLHRGRNILRRRLAKYAAERGYGASADAPHSPESAPAVRPRQQLSAHPTSQAA